MDSELSARELKIAEKAAELAVERMTKQFYQEVGKTVVSRWLIVVGGMVVAYFMGKGWLAKLLS